MKKFTFGLDSVLDYRQQVLEGQQNEYAKALKLVSEQQERVDAAKERYQTLNARFRSEAAVGITAAEAMGFENGLRVLEAEIARETQILQNLQREAEEKRGQVIQAHMDAVVLERLKEKKMEAYQREAQKLDERFIDELISSERLARSQM